MRTSLVCLFSALCLLGAEICVAAAGTTGANILEIPVGARAIAMGDGSNDLQMMSVAGLSVAFRAKPVVRTTASVVLNAAGLDGLLARPD